MSLVRTPTETLATVEEDASMDVPSPAGGPGECLINLPSGPLVVKQAAASAASQPERLDQIVHPGTTQLESPPPNLTGEPSAVTRDAADVDRTADEDRPADENCASDDRLTTGEVRRRAVTGAVVDALRAIGVKLVAVLGALVTARLLTPYDFGLVAIGTTVLAFGRLARRRRRRRRTHSTARAADES